MIAWKLSCIFIALVAFLHTGSAAPVLNKDEHLAPESKRRDTTLETLELEQSLKRLSGENKKFFPNPYKEPVMQVDGLMHESPGTSKDATHLEHRLPSEREQEPTADIENELKAASEEESNSAETQLESKSEEESNSAESELNNASEEETVESVESSPDDAEDAQSEESIEEDTGDANEDQSDGETEQQAASPEQVEERSRESEEERAETVAEFTGMEKRVNPNSAWGQEIMAEEEEEEFIEALLSLLERHPELANLLLKVEEEDEEHVDYDNYYPRAKQMHANFHDRPAADSGMRNQDEQLLESLKRKSQDSWAGSREYYQGLAGGDRQAHVVAKKMMERYNQ